MSLIKELTPIFEEDNHEWQELISEFSGNIPSLFWYGGAAFDRTPIIALFDDSFPKEIQKALSPDILPVLTDYDSSIIKSFKYIYENFDKVDFSLGNMSEE